MNRHNTYILASIVTLGILVPSIMVYADSYQFKAQGIFGCNETGAYGMSVGSLSAVGGVYVPVNDAAVTLNTGYLVYKECVLRNVVDRIRESVTSAIANQTIETGLTGRDGEPMFSVDLIKEQLEPADAAELDFLNSFSSSINPAYKDQIQKALAKSYVNSTRNPFAVLTCPETKNLNDIYSRNNTNVWDGLSTMADPACDPISVFVTASQLSDTAREQAVGDVMQQLNWGNGYYPKATKNPDGTLIVQTPADMIEKNITQAVQAGFEEAKAANDIGQVVGALFSGMASQTITGDQGFAGLNKSSGSQPSYLNAVAASSGSGLRTAVDNAVKGILTNAMNIEKSYYDILNSIGQLLVKTATTIRGQERACWNLIINGNGTIPGVCASAVTANNTCTDKAGNTLHIATSTNYSDQVINNQITTLASNVAGKLDTSGKMLQKLSDLYKKGDSSATQEVDSLVASHALHNQQDLNTLSGQQTSVASNMANLIDCTPGSSGTCAIWGDGTPNYSNPSDVNSGWCNIADPKTIPMWDQIWQH